MPLRKDGGSRADEVGPQPIDGWIGSRVRMLRNQRGLRAVDLAEGIGITRQQMERYEKGEARLHASRLWDIAVMLDAPPGWFFQDFPGRSAPQVSPEIDVAALSAQGVRLVSQFERLRAEQRKAVAMVCQAFEAENAGTEGGA